MINKEVTDNTIMAMNSTDGESENGSKGKFLFWAAASEEPMTYDSIQGNFSNLMFFPPRPPP